MEVTAGAGVGMDVDGHSETATFGGDVAEQEVLEKLVLRIGRGACEAEFGVDTLGIGAFGGIEIERAQVGGFELLGERATGLVSFESCGDYAGVVVGERRRQGG